MKRIYVQLLAAGEEIATRTTPRQWKNGRMTITKRQRKAINKLINTNPAETSEAARTASTKALKKAPAKPRTKPTS